MKIKAKEVMKLISSKDLDLTEYSDTLVYHIIERITVLSKKKFANKKSVKHHLMIHRLFIS